MGEGESKRACARGTGDAAGDTLLRKSYQKWKSSGTRPSRLLGMQEQAHVPVVVADVPVRSLEPVPPTAPPAQAEDLKQPPGYLEPGQAGPARDLPRDGGASSDHPGVRAPPHDLGGEPPQQAVKVEMIVPSGAVPGHVLGEVQGGSQPPLHSGGMGDAEPLGTGASPSSPAPAVSREADPSGSGGPSHEARAYARGQDTRGLAGQEGEASGGSAASSEAGVTWRSPVGALLCQLPAGVRIEECVLFWLGGRALAVLPHTCPALLLVLRWPSYCGGSA